MGNLDKFFQLAQNGTTAKRELTAGLTTFAAMAYILAVNPVILSAAGMDKGAVITATALASAIMTAAMALATNYPIALAPGMGMNAFFAYGICVGSGVPWQTALGMVFWAGLFFVVLTVTGARRMLVRAVPEGLKLAGAVGIGLFIAFIGLQHGGIVRGDENTLVAMGDLSSPAARLTLFGLAVSLVLMAIGVRTAIFWGLVVTIAAGLLTGEAQAPAALVSVPSLAALPGFQIDILGALRLEYLPLILVLLFFALFDTLGTLMGIAHQAGFMRNGELPRVERALTADALGMVGGALLGTSPVTSYIESGSGVGVGARTGLANVMTGGLLLLSLFFTPLVAMISRPDAAGFTPLTAPALVLVGILMVRAVAEIDWADPTEAAPAFFTALLMPLTFNISHGLAAGIVVYALVKLAARRGQEVHWLMYVFAALFVLRYAFLPA